jgi:hypothetical protein
LTWKIPAAGKPGDGAPGKSGDSGLFEEARKTLPHPLPAEKSPVNWRWQGDTLVLAAPGATGLTFYPDEKCATLADPIRQADANTETLSLDITKEKGLIGPVSGVVQIKRGAERPSDYYTILVPGPSGKKDPP